ncbi:MAG: hypothetical protein AB4040_07660 [Synechococcus sp.]
MTETKLLSSPTATASTRAIAVPEGLSLAKQLKRIVDALNA